MNKKAQFVQEHLRKIVIAVVIILVMIPAVKLMAEKINDRGTVAKCKASVKAYSAGKSFNELTSKNIEEKINCPAEDLMIDNSNEQYAKFQIAESMKRCWDKFWKGKLNLYSGQGIFCSVCSVI